MTGEMTAQKLKKISMCSSQGFSFFLVLVLRPSNSQNIVLKHLATKLDIVTTSWKERFYSEA